MIASYLKDKRVLIAGGVTIAAIMLFQILRPKDTNITMTAEGMGQTNMDMLAQAATVAIEGEKLKMQRDIAMGAMENERYITDVGLAMLKENNAAYLTGLEQTNQFALSSQISAEDHAFASLMETNKLNQYLGGVASHTAIETARLEGDAAVRAAKASKKKGFSIGGFSLSF